MDPIDESISALCKKSIDVHVEMAVMLGRLRVAYRNLIAEEDPFHPAAIETKEVLDITEDKWASILVEISEMYDRTGTDSTHYIHQTIANSIQESAKLLVELASALHGKPGRFREIMSNFDQKIDTGDEDQT